MNDINKNTVTPNNANKSVSQHKQLDAIWSAMNLAVHTERVCANKKIFSLNDRIEDNKRDLEQDDYIVTRIHESAINVYLYARRANRIRVTQDDPDSKKYRLDLIFESVLSCDELLDLITIARPLYHLKTKKYENWIRMVVTIKSQLSAWYRSEKCRYH